jgi:uncharacterized protein YbgA (DUF1722 family)
MTTPPTNLLLHPHRYDPRHFDAETRRLLRATIDWFEQRGKRKLVAITTPMRTTPTSWSSRPKKACSAPS